MDFTITELRQLIKYCANDRNSTRVNTKHFEFVTKLMDKLIEAMKSLNKIAQLQRSHLQTDTKFKKTLVRKDGSMFHLTDNEIKIWLANGDIEPGDFIYKTVIDTTYL